jgi:gliding motility-associated-like protein
MIHRLKPHACLLLVALFFWSVPAFPTHQRAAEIIYKHVSGLTYEFTLISYTYTPSPANAYRDYLLINWGDGTTSEIKRVEITYLPNDISYNRYYGTHTFPGPSNYTISCEDPNRNGGILNIPNSINTPLYIYSELVINPFMGGYNNSPVLLLPPIDNGCVDQPYYHNPGAYDADGDSLSYRLVPCRGAQGLVIPGYTYPPASNVFKLDSVTGDLTWDSPQQQGEYNIAILIEEWRNGIKIGSVLRDMQIIIIACNNKPPVIDPLPDTCIEAGQTLTFPVKAWDPDSNVVTLTATGGPMLVPNSPALQIPNPASGTGHVQATFKWATLCEHVKRNPYSMFFKAIDNATPVKLVDIKSMKIRVIGPAPKDLTATPMGNTITLNWSDYTCTNATGYQIWRKTDSTGYIPGYCQTGVPPYLGYVMIDQLQDITQTSYLDNNKGSGLVRGIRYCYLVVATYPDKAESYASNEACAALKKDVAVITNVSINHTGTTNGSIYIAWSKPTEIDTIQAPGPYKYLIARSRSDQPSQFVTVDSLSTLNDTIYTDTLLNTAAYHFTYRIDLVNDTPGNRFLIGISQPASSMFLRIFPTDKRLKLIWNNDVPWSNKSFTILRFDPATQKFDSVGASPLPAYVDKGLANGTEYCYIIRSTGSYSAHGFVDPIINFSQENCAVPVDNIPPCPPLLTIVTHCSESMNRLIWTYPSDTCGRDIARYIIFYSPNSTDPLEPFDSVDNPFDTVYDHRPDQSIVGCYAVMAVDSAGNRSTLSAPFCINNDACPVYELPNIFTPNGDGKNDYLKPFPYTSVAEISLKLFNRWGGVVFETSDPDINWDGTDRTTGRVCSDGVYFYTCDVFEITLTGTVKRTIQGSVTILK